MTPQEKAKELVDKFRKETDGIAGYNYDSVNLQCALIAVEELIKQEEKYNNGSFYPSNYWTEVKAEIQKF